MTDHDVPAPADAPDAPAPAWHRQRDGLVVGVLAVSVVALGTVAADADVALRPLAVFLFLLLGPGLAVTGFLRLADPATEIAVAVPLSLALDALVAGVLNLGSWRPGAAVVVTAAAASVALAVQLRHWLTGVRR